MGGRDFDDVLLKMCLDAFQENFEINLRTKSVENERAMQRLRAECEKAKIELSKFEHASIRVS